MKLSLIVNEERSGAVRYGNETVAYKYKPGALTEEYLDARLKPADPDSADANGRMARFLSPIITFIDVQDEAGGDLAPNEENLAQLPAPFLDQMIEDITKSARMSVKTGKVTVAK